jgi:NADH:ubiquinone oxidoreductase subunit 3 (subunit A)
MMSSWDSYYIVFLSAILSLAIPSLLALISFCFFPNSSKHLGSYRPPQLDGCSSNRTILGQRVNVSFFLAANASLILITLALELIPCATTLQFENREGLFKGLIAIVTIAGFSVLGLLYSVRKGDMSWLDHHQKDRAFERKMQ